MCHKAVHGNNIDFNHLSVWVELVRAKYFCPIQNGVILNDIIVCQNVNENLIIIHRPRMADSIRNKQMRSK